MGLEPGELLRLQVISLRSLTPEQRVRVVEQQYDAERARRKARAKQERKAAAERAKLAARERARRNADDRKRRAAELAHMRKLAAQQKRAGR